MISGSTRVKTKTLDFIVHTTWSIRSRDFVGERNAVLTYVHVYNILFIIWTHRNVVLEHQQTRSLSTCLLKVSCHQSERIYLSARRSLLPRWRYGNVRDHDNGVMDIDDGIENIMVSWLRLIGWCMGDAMVMVMFRLCGVSESHLSTDRLSVYLFPPFIVHHSIKSKSNSKSKSRKPPPIQP
jgi:hypothetical protein